MPDRALTLYHFRGCPYCARVDRAIQDLGLDLARKDTQQDPEAHQALLAARGRGTVPVLHIQDGDHTTWMPESADIIRYLYAEYGNGRTPPLMTRVNPMALAIAVGLALWFVLRAVLNLG